MAGVPVNPVLPPLAPWQRRIYDQAAASIDAGRLGRLQVRGSEIILGAPLLMNKGNIDKYDF